MEKNKNNVTMIGQLENELEFAYEAYGERFYSSKIICPRKSGTEDIIPITVSELLIEKSEQYVGKTVKICGSFRSYNKDGHLLLSVFANEFSVYGEDEIKNNNAISLDGYICKQPIFRETPLGRQITDVLIAVNRSKYKSDYIPCIFWEENAIYTSGLNVGTHIAIIGRIQSREYKETKVAYEVSVSKVEEKK